MEASDIKLTTSAEDIYRLVREVKNLKAVNVELRKDIDASQKAQDCLRAEFAAYKASEAEREANIRKSAFEEYWGRTKVLELNEKRVEAYKEYLTTEGLSLFAIKSVLEKRITKADRSKIEKEQNRITAAWEKFDAIQKQIAKESGVAPWELDICKNDSICAECAAKMGKVPVDYPVGHWTGKCDFCWHEKSLSSLSRDYVDREGAKE